MSKCVAAMLVLVFLTASCVITAKLVCAAEATAKGVVGKGSGSGFGVVDS